MAPMCWDNSGIPFQHWAAARRQISRNGDLMAARHKIILAYRFSAGLGCCHRLCSRVWGRCVQLPFGTAHSAASVSNKCWMLSHCGHQWSSPFPCIHKVCYKGTEVRRWLYSWIFLFPKDCLFRAVHITGQPRLSDNKDIYQRIP